MQPKNNRCYLCEKIHGISPYYKVLHEHHVFGGPANRKLSEQYGLKVYLCPAHHEWAKEAVHNNADNMRLIRQDGQRAFEKEYPDLDFKEIFGRNYL